MFFKKSLFSVFVLLMCLSGRTSDVREYSLSDILQNSSDRHGNMEVIYRDGSKFTRDRYGNLFWQSGDTTYSKDRYGEVSLTSGAAH